MSGKKRTDKTAKSQWYEDRRNELLGLLGEATALALPEKYAEQLRGTMRKCQEDAFEIALVGEFQGGKSTTFNALCDGRDISPRGLGGGGIKTSAAVISAQNIAGNETKDGLSEWAEVAFKEPAALALGLSTILRPALVDSPELRRLNDKISDENYENAISTDDGFPELVDLGNPECLALLRKTADGLWQKWEADKANALDSDQLDQLRIATLQLRFFGTKEQKKLLERTTMPLDRFQKLVAFPKDWETRWRDGGKARFGFDEVAFVFVRAVLVRLHSANLQRLGCRITDCPGLFANAFDTCVAESAIRRADAVWYLIGGERQLGEKDKLCIQKIASWGLAGKIQATANIRTDWETKSTEVLDTTKSILSNMGLAFEVIPYNARLAFLAAQGGLLLARPDRFSELDKANMAVDAKPKADAPPPPPSEMWHKMVRRVGSAMAVEELEDIDALDAASVGTARKASHFGEILARLENDIIPLKARSILVDNGSGRAAEALVAYEGVLRATEMAAEEQEAEWRGKLEQARKQLADFVKGANTVIDRSVLGASQDQTVLELSTDIVKLALDDEYAETLSRHIAEKIVEKENDLYMSEEAMAKDLERSLAPVFSEDSKAAMSRALEKWKKGKSRARFRRSLEFLCEDIHELWEQRKISAVEMLQSFSPPTIREDDINEVSDHLSSALFQEQRLLAALELGRGFWSSVGRIVMAVIKGFFTGFLLPILLPIMLLRDSKKAAEAERKERREKIERMVPQIKPEVLKIVDGVHFREGIGRPLEEQLSESLGHLADKLRARLEDLKTDFEKERVAKNEQMFNQTVAERKRIAAENKAIRTETIMPLRKRIEAFKTAVSAELGS